MTKVFLKSYDQLALAELERGLLEAQGIKCLLKRSNLGMIYGSSGSGGADIYVLAEDLEKAKEILAND